MDTTERDGELAGIRTQDPRLKRALLYLLSYELVQCRYFQITTGNDLLLSTSPSFLWKNLREFCLEVFYKRFSGFESIK
jgi:hypothetical protein